MGFKSGSKQHCLDLGSGELQVARSRSCKLATPFGRAFHCTMASGKMNIYNKLYWFEFGDKSLGGNTGVLCEWVGHSLYGLFRDIYYVSGLFHESA